MARENDLGNDSITQLVLKLAIPTMIAQFVNMLYSIIDRIYIGNIPGEGSIALAGVGICGPIVTLLSSFGTLIGLGGSILMAMRMGEGNMKRAKQILSNSFLTLVVLSVTLTVSFLLMKDKLLMWFGASETTFVYANTYMTIYTAGTFFALMAIGLNYFITCQGFSTIGMATVLIGAFANIVLDPIFIFVFDMGVAGAAIATVISQILSCSFAIGFLFGKRPPIKISFGNYSMGIILRIAAIGLSPFLILATDSVIMIIMNSVLQRTGGANADMLITAATIVNSYMSLITGPMGGISGGTQAIISFNYGAGKTERVRDAEKKILLLCVVFTVIMFTISRFSAESFARIFVSDAEEIALAGWGIRTFTLAIIPLAFQYALVDGLTAMGRTKTALFLSMFRKISYAVLIVVFAYVFGAKNAFYSEPVMDFIGATMSTIVFLLVFEKHMKHRTEMTEAI
jgi:putative MATE family efflux protein